MKRYKVTACYYDEIEVDAESEADAHKFTKGRFNQTFYWPDEVIVEKVYDYDDPEEDD